MSRLIAICAALTLWLAAPAAQALTLLRDADMEHALRQVAAPVLQAAGLPDRTVRILVVDSGTLNAFVADTQTIFIHSGMISRLDTAAELQAVIAHEAAHITGGHIARRLGNLGAAQTAARLGMILGLAAGVAGDGRVGFAIAAGSQNSAMQRFFAHTRAEEASADITSVRILVRAGIDPNAAVAVQEIFRGQEALSVGRQDPYSRTHPTSRDRVRALEGLVTGQPTPNQDPDAAYWFARAKGKLTAFQRAPSWTLTRAADSPTRDIELMRLAVAHHRNSDTAAALRAIDGAIAARGGADPYLSDLKGQILLESRNIDAAVAAYRAAAEAAPREPLILGGLGRALLAARNPDAARGVLETARARDNSDARILRDLGAAYAQTGQAAMASLVTAERYALRARWPDAKLHATRAADRLPRGSGPWQRAQDVLLAVQTAERR